ncbi:MAG: hypothetical protein ACOCV4_02940 [Myxococcota bacterium]
MAQGPPGDGPLEPRRRLLRWWAVGSVLVGLLVLPLAHLVGHRDDHVHGARGHRHGAMFHVHSDGTEPGGPADSARSGEGSDEAPAAGGGAPDPSHGQGSWDHFGQALASLPPAPRPVAVRVVPREAHVLRAPEMPAPRAPWSPNPVRGPPG